MSISGWGVRIYLPEVGSSQTLSSKERGEDSPWTSRHAQTWRGRRRSSPYPPRPPACSSSSLSPGTTPTRATSQTSFWEKSLRKCCSMCRRIHFKLKKNFDLITMILIWRTSLPYFIYYFPVITSSQRLWQRRISEILKTNKCCNLEMSPLPAWGVLVVWQCDSDCVK